MENTQINMKKLQTQKTIELYYLKNHYDHTKISRLKVLEEPKLKNSIWDYWTFMPKHVNLLVFQLHMLSCMSTLRVIRVGRCGSISKDDLT